MIKILHGNIFSTKCDCIVNTVNCVGFMGRGIALEMSIRYPEMEKAYKEKCEANAIEIGSLWLYSPQDGSQKILNFPTKIDYKYPSKIEYLEKGLETFKKEYRTYGINSIAFPVLGTQNGKINFDIALNLMSKYLSSLDDLDVEIYILDSLNFEKDRLFLKFMNYISTSSDKKCLELADNLSLRNDIYTFADMTKKKISEEQDDGSYKRKSIATKQFLQKIIVDIKKMGSRPSGLNVQTSLFDALDV